MNYEPMSNIIKVGTLFSYLLVCCVIFVSMNYSFIGEHRYLPRHQTLKNFQQQNTDAFLSILFDIMYAHF